MEDEVKKLITLAENGKLVGEFKNIPNDVYHHNDCPALSRSDLVTARRSLRHLEAKKSGEIEKKTSKAMEFGSLVHDYILEPDTFWQIYCEDFSVPPVEGDKRKKEIREKHNKWLDQKAKWEEVHKDQKVVTKEDYEIVKKMADQLDYISTVQEIMTGEGTEFENSYFYDCPIFERRMKFRPDIIMKEQRIMIDLKTAADASPNEFRKSMVNHYYDLQAAMYSYGAHQLFGEKWTFAFIVVEKTAPFGVALYTAGESEIEMGMDIYKDTAKIMKEKPIKTAYPQQFSDIGLPAWGYDLSRR